MKPEARWSRLRSLWSWRRKDAELDDEIRFHLSEEAEERAAGGVPPDEARAAASKDFGNPTLVRETLRETWTWSFAEHLRQDVRHGLRLMRRSPVFTVVAVLSLGLGIGANTAIFSVVDALLLKPLPVSHPEQLVSPVYHISEQTFPFSTFNYADFVLWRDHLEGISGIAAVAEMDRSTLQIGGSATAESEAVHLALVSGTYFSTLGITSRAGRALTADDDREAGGHPVAVISDDYWRDRFQRAPEAIGQTFKLNATTYSIVGVMRAGFSGDWIGHPTEIWIPMAMQSEVMVEQPGLLTSHGPMWLRMVVRLKPETSLKITEDRANALESGGDAPVSHAINFESLSHGYSQERRFLRAPALIVLGLAAMVLLIACANVANLLLARASARQAEMTVRVALGASRGRIVRQSLTESLILASMAGIVGLAVAAGGTNALGNLIGLGELPLALDLHLDLRVLLFTAAISLTTAVIFGMAPASASWRRSLTTTVAARVSGAPARFRLARILVIAQVALSLLLMISSGLFMRTLRNLRAQDLGLDRNHVLLVKTAPEQAGLIGGAIADLMRRLPDQIAVLPGVESVAAASYAVLGGVGSGTRCTVPGYTYAPDEDLFVRTNQVTPRYFESVGIRLSAGRDLTIGDDSRSARVAVINEAMARYYWGTVNVVGRRFGLARDTGNEIEVVGVVKDAQTEGLRGLPDRTVFLPYGQYAGRLRSLTLAIRTQGPIGGMREPVRSLLHAAAAGLPVVSLSTVDDNVDRMVRTERLLATLSGIFGGLALVLACLGLYGMVSYVTARRTNEIAVRIALGAERREIHRLVVGASLALVLVGIAIGVTTAALTMRVAESSLYGVSPTDTATITMAAVVMLVVTSAAAFVPANRAANVSPIVALRAE